MRLIMLGAPGAGKGSQATVLSKKYNIPHISTGDIFRANIKAGTELGNKAKSYMDQGLLVPDELTCELVVNRIQQEDCKNGYILDGFPRTIAQAEVLDAALDKIEDTIDWAINLEVPDEVIISRMSGRRFCQECGATYHLTMMPPKKEGVCDKCGHELVLRNDDRPQTVEKRLHVYHDQTAPLIHYYGDRHICVDIDGTQMPEEVLQDIVKHLGE